MLAGSYTVFSVESYSKAKLTLLIVSLPILCVPVACLSWSNMGAWTTKMRGNEQGNKLGGSRKRELKTKKKQRSNTGRETDQLNFHGGEEANMKRKTLQELHMDPPPAFRKFESEVD